VGEDEGAQPQCLGLPGQERGDEPGEQDGLLAEVDADPVGPRGRGMALGEDQVDDAEHAREALGHALGGRDGERHAAVAQLALGPGQPLGQRALRDEERAGDLRRPEARDGAQGQRHLGVDRERGMTAREEELELRVGQAVGRAFVCDLALDRVEDVRVEQDLAPASRGPRRPARHHGQPGARAGGNTASRPGLQCGDEGVLDGVLRARQVAQLARKRGDDRRPFATGDELHVPRMWPAGPHGARSCVGA